MARLDTYGNDANVTDSDRLLATDGGTGEAGTAGPTVNIEVGDLKTFINGGVTENFLPVSDDSGSYEASLIQQVTLENGNEQLIVGGNIQFTGLLTDGDGNALIDASGEGADIELTPGPYTTGVITSGNSYDASNTINANTVFAIVSAPATDIFLPAAGSIPSGSWVKISNLTSDAEIAIHGNGAGFMNEDSASTPRLILDNHTASFELVYIAELPNPGWVIIGSQGEV